MSNSTPIKTPLSDGSVDWLLNFERGAKQVSSAFLKAYYQSSVPAADTPLSRVPFLAMDFETTGLDASRDEIVSIGVVPFTLERIHYSQSKHWLVKPIAPLNADSVVFHGITHRDLDEAEDFENVIEPLLKVMAGRVLVVHYRSIERPFLYRALEQRIHEGVVFPVVDTMAIEASLCRSSMWARIKQKLGIKPESIRLGDSRMRYGLPNYPSHHALTDALATAELFQAEVAYHLSPETPIGDIWL